MDEKSRQPAGPAGEPILAAVDVRYSIGRKEILRGASFEVRRGETFLILASSGAGKSTLLRACVGMLHPDGGRVLVEGRNLASLSPDALQNLRTRVRFAFEDAVLLSNMSLMENIAFPLYYHTRMDAAAIRERVREEMARLKILDCAGEQPAAVDRSVRRRAHLAMALMLKPDLLVLDNPLAGFDPDIAAMVVKRLQRLREENGTTILMASHTLEMLSHLADSVGILEDGRILKSGTLAVIMEMLRSVDDSRLGMWSRDGLRFDNPKAPREGPAEPPEAAGPGEPGPALPGEAPPGSCGA
ncbi:MAG: ATP-binding cassette domain-containing protein [Planctomycetes bacterium]|jgi:phospholipid/cholesterol/gamma-HCH transport system ATP-binding protein|nr:ATP-binding cassette domain-containing protein [Planctomycetota bacterium]